MYDALDHALKTFNELVKLLPSAEQAKPQLIILAGEATGYRNDTDRELPFRQESNFYYLTGCVVPSSFVLATYQPGASLDHNPSVQLFIPEANEDDIMWSVPPPSLSEASQTHNVTRVDHPTAFVDALDAILTALPEALVHTLPKDSIHFPELPEKYIASLMKNESAAITDLYLLTALSNARLIKDKREIEDIRKANAISSRAHETVMRVLGLAVKHGLKNKVANTNPPKLPGEWLIETEAQAEAIFVASFRREGAAHQAYLPIVAASTRASTLHYCCNDREFSWGPVEPLNHRTSNNATWKSHEHEGEQEIEPQVLLIDAGCEWDCYASDITRTMPVGNGGRFTPEARAIYSLVLSMQTSAFTLVRPGVHWDEVQLECHRVFIKGFLELGIFKKRNEEEILASGISASFFPHGVGHSLGMDVHDVPSVSKVVNRQTRKVAVMGNGREAHAAKGEGDGRWGHPSFYTYLRLRRPLERGMVVTVEPGIYFSPHLMSKGKVWESEFVDAEALKKYVDVGGVRIEDVVVVTEGEKGYENLTTVRSDVEWVEGVCSGRL